jgi:ELP3 family radical SAM enzyme/protein acetyltransferase
VNDTRFRFEPALHERELAAIITEIEASPELDLATLDRILRRHPRGGVGLFAKTEIVRGARHLAARGALAVDPDALARRLRTAPVRSHSGILPVTVLTRPHPCPGHCVFCPSDARMPKSYLASEPGAQRAEQHGFDPYRQTRARLEAFRSMGHPLDKVELIVLGGTWSAYPLAYRLWFVQRCLEALCDFGVDGRPPDASAAPFGSFEALPAAARGVYNETVSAHLRARQAGRLRAPEEEASWDDLARAQQRNEEAAVRCVGLSLETRPDEVDADEVLCLRRLGATKIQLGIQSLSDEVLHRNQRGHDVAATREAMTLLRGAGFKLHAHWMPNLLGSTPEADLADFERLFADPAIRPDELKLYPCSLVESAELMDHQRAGAWRPYADDELLHVVSEAMRRTPRWCRLTRVVRDIPSPDIVVGNKRTNFREVAEHARDPRRELRSPRPHPARDPLRHGRRHGVLPRAHDSRGPPRRLRAPVPAGAAILRVRARRERRSPRAPRLRSRRRSGGSLAGPTPARGAGAAPDRRGLRARSGARLPEPRRHLLHGDPRVLPQARLPRRGALPAPRTRRLSSSQLFRNSSASPDTRASTEIFEPSGKSPSRIRTAIGSWTMRWMTRLSGRAP